MPKQVDHQERRQSIARALWTVVEQQGWMKATMREVARQSGVSLGQLQHYFSTREEMLSFAIDFAAEQTSRRVEAGIAALPQPPHPRAVLRLVLIELLPLTPDARAVSRLNAAYVLEAMHDSHLHDKVSRGLRDGRALVERLIREAIDLGCISPNCDPEVEADLILALTGFAPLLELKSVEPKAVYAAIDQHLDRLFLPSH